MPRYHGGMDIYLVGGAVRDKLLGLPVAERDWVVVGATPEAMIALGYTPVGKDFPVFLHPETHEEYALARTERKTAPGYTGFVVHAAPEVTLEEDLRRRDLTVNAMAEAPDGTLIDPFNGREDLQNGVLRHVSPAFVEDPVRILRVARFAARFGRWGFHVAHGTHALMRQMVEDGEVDALVPERVWAEMARALEAEQPVRFFQVLQRCGALARIWPELAAHVPVSAGHEHQAMPQVLAALERAALLDADARVRFATLTAALTPEALTQSCKRFKVPNEFRELAEQAAGQCPRCNDNPDAEDMLAWLETSDALRRPGRFEMLLKVCAALRDDTGKNEWSQRLLQARQIIAAISGASLAAEGLQGADIAAALRKRRLAALQKLQ